MILIAAACLAAAGGFAQRELFNRDRQIEIRDGEMNRLHALVELGERKLAAEEILLRSLRAHLMKKDVPAK